MRARQIGQPLAFDHELLVGISDVGLAWQVVGGEGVHGGVAAGAEGAVGEGGSVWVSGAVAGRAAGAVCQGLRLWGSVARLADAGESGKTNGPVWPHAVNIAAPPTRAWAVTRIRVNFNMLRL